MYNCNLYPKTNQPPQNQYGWGQQMPQPQAQQPMYTNWQPQPQMIQAGLKGRPVSSFDEARVSTIDFDGSVFYFPDLANGKIYTKQINMDGTASVNVYTLTEMPKIQQNSSTPDCITRGEFEQAMNQLKSAILSLAPQDQQQKKEELKSFI